MDVVVVAPAIQATPRCRCVAGIKTGLRCQKLRCRIWKRKWRAMLATQLSSRLRPHSQNNGANDNKHGNGMKRSGCF
jgi:hypothetical protein